MKPVRLLAMVAVATLGLAGRPALADDWSPWYSLTDGHRNQLDVRYQRSTLKASDGRCDIKYQFRNRYQDRVSFTYQVIVDGGRMQTERGEEIGAGQTSGETTYARNTRDIRMAIRDLRAAGSGSVLPR